MTDPMNSSVFHPPQEFPKYSIQYRAFLKAHDGKSPEEDGNYIWWDIEQRREFHKSRGLDIAEKPADGWTEAEQWVALVISHNAEYLKWLQEKWGV